MIAKIWLTELFRNRIVELMIKKFLNQRGAVPVGIAIFLLVTSLVGLVAGYKAVQTPTRTGTKADTSICNTVEAVTVEPTTVNINQDFLCNIKIAPDVDYHYYICGVVKENAPPDDWLKDVCHNEDVVAGNWDYANRTVHINCNTNKTPADAAYFASGGRFKLIALKYDVSCHQGQNPAFATGRKEVVFQINGSGTPPQPTATTAPGQPTQPPAPSGNRCFYLTAEFEKSPSNDFGAYVSFNTNNGDSEHHDIKLDRNHVHVAGWNRWDRPQPFTYWPEWTGGPFTAGQTVTFTGRDDMCGDREGGNIDEIVCTLSATGVSGTSGRCSFRGGVPPPPPGATNTPIPTTPPQPGKATIKGTIRSNLNPIPAGKTLKLWLCPGIGSQITNCQIIQTVNTNPEQDYLIPNLTAGPYTIYINTSPSPDPDITVTPDCSSTGGTAITSPAPGCATASLPAGLTIKVDFSIAKLSGPPPTSQCDTLTVTVRNERTQQPVGENFEVNLLHKIPPPQQKTNSSGKASFYSVEKLSRIPYSVLDYSGSYQNKQGIFDLIKDGCDQNVLLKPIPQTGVLILKPDKDFGEYEEGTVDFFDFFIDDSPFSSGCLKDSEPHRQCTFENVSVGLHRFKIQAKQYQQPSHITIAECVGEVSQYDFIDHNYLVEKSCELSLTPKGGTKPQESVYFWGERSTFNGQPLPAGTLVKAWASQQGKQCGLTIVAKDGSYGLRCYRSSQTVPGAEPGDPIYFTFRDDNLAANSTGPDTAVWTNNGDRRHVELNIPAAAGSGQTPGQTQNIVQQVQQALQTAGEKIQEIVFQKPAQQPEIKPTTVSGKVRVNNSTFAAVEKVIVALYTDLQGKPVAEAGVNLINKEGTFEFANLENKEYYTVAFARTTDNLIYQSETAKVKPGDKTSLTVNIGEQGLRYTLKKTKELGTTVRTGLSGIPVIGPFLDMFITVGFN